MYKIFWVFFVKMTYLLYNDESGLFELSADVAEAVMIAEATGCCGGC